jgi:methylenetetrahydrofolate reductase (NADPH)
MAYLKEKVDAGANCIITQLFYDVNVFLTFVKRCRDEGINVPILPGMMPLGSYGGFRRMTGFCKTRVPAHMEEALKDLTDDDVKFKEYGVKLLTEMSKEVWASGTVRALHFYCLNQYDTVFKIMKGLGIEVNPLETEEEVAALAETKALVKKTLEEQAAEAAVKK